MGNRNNEFISTKLLPITNEEHAGKTASNQKKGTACDSATLVVALIFVWASGSSQGLESLFTLRGSWLGKLSPARLAQVVAHIGDSVWHDNSNRTS